MILKELNDICLIQFIEEPYFLQCMCMIAKPFLLIYLIPLSDVLAQQIECD